MKIVLVSLCLLMMSSLALADDAKQQWEVEADARIEKLRKGDFTLTLNDAAGKPLANTPVKLNQTGHHFMFGTAVGGDPLKDDPISNNYRAAIIKYFNVIVNENDLKWGRIEPKRDELHFERGDAWLKWAEEHDITVRGHCLFWAKYGMVQDWLKALPENERREEALEHLRETVEHFKGRLYSWDVNNEMLNGNYFMHNLGPDLRPDMFKIAHEIDPKPLLFVNEYEIPNSTENTNKLISLVRGLQKDGAKVGGIGLQEHRLERLNLSGNGKGYTPELFLANLDKLAELDMPIHFTEITCRKGKDDQAKGEILAAMYRIGFSHPKVEAIVLWGFFGQRHWKGTEATLVNDDGSLKPSGKIVFDLLDKQWMTHDLEATTDAAGKVTFRGFYGTYSVVAGDAKAKVKLTPEKTVEVLSLEK